MNSESKVRFDALETLRSAAWMSFDTRRAFEWKLALGLWTALAAFIGTVLSGDVPIRIIGCPRLFVVLIVSTLFALHVHFVRGIVIAHHIDRRIVYLMRDEMMKLATVGFCDDLKKRIDERAKTMPDIFNWSYLPQLGVTGVLSLGAILCLFQ